MHPGIWSGDGVLNLCLDRRAGFHRRRLFRSFELSHTWALDSHRLLLHCNFNWNICSSDGRD